MRFFPRHSILLICLIPALHSCFIENAKTEKVQQLILASDFLFPKDSLFFAGFNKTKNVQVIVKHLSPDSIKKLYETNPTYPGFDIVLLKSITSAEKLNKFKMLHSINEFYKRTEYPEHISLKYNLVELGIDPFVIIQREDTSKLFRNYNDLHQHMFYSRIDREELGIFICPLLKKSGKVKTKKWLEKAMNNQNKNDSLDLTLSNIPGIFCLYSDYESSISKDINYRGFKKLIFPNQNSSGVIYNSRTIGVIKQCPNYVNALKFIAYYLNPDRNIYLNKCFNTISHSSRDPYIRKERGKFDSFLPYQKIANRLLKKVQP